MKIEVLYKDYSLIDNAEHLIQEEFECWQEEGYFASFYKKYDLRYPVADLIIPNHAICWIRPKK